MVHLLTDYLLTSVAAQVGEEEEEAWLAPENAPLRSVHLTMQVGLSPFRLRWYQVEVAEQTIGVEEVEEAKGDLKLAL